MSIVDTFDLHGKEIIKAKNNVGVIENFPKTVIVVFISMFHKLFLDKYSASKIGALNAGGDALPIYQFEYKGVFLGFFHTILGGAGAAALLEEIIALGAEKRFRTIRLKRGQQTHFIEKLRVIWKNVKQKDAALLKWNVHLLWL